MEEAPVEDAYARESVKEMIIERERRHICDSVAALNVTSVAVSGGNSGGRAWRGHSNRLRDGRCRGGRAPALHVGVGRGGRKNSEGKEDVEERGSETREHLEEYCRLSCSMRDASA